MSTNPNHVVTQAKRALVMAGGTGGHIFPGLAVAQALREQGWQVHWLGVPGAMEERLVVPQGFAFEGIRFGGLRGKGWRTALSLPWNLARALWQSAAVLRKVQPHVVLGFGGYVTFPGGLMAVLTGRPLMLHEQNSVPGLVNKVLGRVATRVFTAYPQALPRGEWVGNPLREAFTRQPAPDERMAQRQGPLNLLVMGGSLGAQALNEVVPAALALLPQAQRPRVLHQGGQQHLAAMQAAYERAGLVVDGDAVRLVPFIEDTASAMAEADLVICRAGASTVTELAAVGAASILVPFPHAVDDHQTHNARFLVEAGAARLVQQRDLTPQGLVEMIQKSERTLLINQAMSAKKVQKTQAVETLVRACAHHLPAATRQEEA